MPVNNEWNCLRACARNKINGLIFSILTFRFSTWISFPLNSTLISRKYFINKDWCVFLSSLIVYNRYVSKQFLFRITYVAFFSRKMVYLTWSNIFDRRSFLSPEDYSSRIVREIISITTTTEISFTGRQLYCIL